MSIRAIIQSIEKEILTYKDFLNEIPDDQFQIIPPNGGWSFAQLYSHVIHVNQLSLIAIERCINRTATKDGRRLDWRVWLILLLGKLPPGRIKAPTNIADKVSQISKEDARNQLIRYYERLEEVCRKIQEAPGDQKVRHPRLGPLNARQWLRFIDIHMRHHIPQLYRIRAALAK